MEPAEIVETDRNDITCDGGGGALGHPKVALTLGGDDHVDCPYCGRRFVRAAGAAKAAAH